VVSVGDPSVSRAGEPRAKRERLHPDVRQERLLDAAAQIIETEGVSAITMERLGEVAGSSRTLAYSHFRSRGALLLSLYEREAAVYRELYERRLSTAATFEDRMRASISAYLDSICERGVLFVRLMSEPSIETDVEAIRQQRLRRSSSYWVDLAVANGVPQSAAEVVVTMQLAAAGAVGRLVARHPERRDELQEHYMTFALAVAKAARASAADRPPAG
jgi:TetR/AcrR family transcriptional regulator, fatty acid biosynthesis regulator